MRRPITLRRDAAISSKINLRGVRYERSSLNGDGELMGRISGSSSGGWGGRKDGQLRLRSTDDVGDAAVI